MRSQNMPVIWKMKLTDTNFVSLKNEYISTKNPVAMSESRFSWEMVVTDVLFTVLAIVYVDVLVQSLFPKSNNDVS